MRMCPVWKTCSVLHLISCLATVSDAFVLPEELTIAVKTVRLIIPLIKQGLDSRVGLGFRLGDHADFQVIFEIGPQNCTQPLGPEEAQRRRHVKVDDPTHKRQTMEKVEEKPVPDTEGGRWLEKWRQIFSES
ncbi:uncharacterized protein LOC124174071 isoform X2 [Ischnura elegans]|uniref:uncharacterized protein LOC124174071 isoform X2 n=1 Tax=Ischnura elegans TaxID=197161 RepID=UPI001ED8B188|nr:uncharacterized protein LOC124174071 isoform X2 [Ischnura elegans]